MIDLIGLTGPIDLFLDSDSFIITYHISLVSVQSNYCNNNLLILDVKQLNKIIKLYYLKALWDGQGKIKMYYGMSRVEKQLSGKRSIVRTYGAIYSFPDFIDFLKVCLYNFIPFETTLSNYSLELPFVLLVLESPISSITRRVSE